MERTHIELVERSLVEPWCCRSTDLPIVGASALVNHRRNPNYERIER
jgi:hypothetical protein